MKADFKITQLKHFIWVAKLKGFQAAAEKAHRSQPAISLSIRDLEEKLGVPLFEKTTNTGRTARAELTTFGYYFLEQAQELVENHDRLLQDIDLMTTHQKGHLRLASVPSIARQFLPQILREFIKDSKLNVSIYDDHTAAVIEMVEQQKVDFGIAGQPNKHSLEQVEFIPLWQDSLGVVCQIDHPLSDKLSLNWSQLLDYSYIKNGTSVLLENSEAEILLKNAQYNISNMISLIAMLEVNLGITTLPQYAFPTNNSNLKFIPLSSPSILRNIGLVCLKNKTLNPTARKLMDQIIYKIQNN